MDQRTHAWIAIRAVALLEDSGEAPELCTLLRKYLKTAATGAWIPDLQASKLGTGDVDNHILKMAPVSNKRYALPKAKLLKKLGSARKMTGYIEEDTSLDEGWWQQAYQASPQPGQHLANRAMALTVTLVDQLLMGDRAVAELVPGDRSLASVLDPRALARVCQGATYFSMLSHFVADAQDVGSRVKYGSYKADSSVIG